MNTTKTAQFTPGPWVGYTNTDEGRHIISEAYAQDVIVCEQVHTDADISIIAAAPAMYEALQIMVRAANVDEIDPLVMFASIERARHVLKLAEGKSA